MIEAYRAFTLFEALQRPHARKAVGALHPAFAMHALALRLPSTDRHHIEPDRASVCDFLEEVRFSSASDSKDKILALYQLLTNAGVSLPAPDYTKSTATTYREATIVIIQSTGSIQILEQVDSLGKTPDSASWAPDWASSKHCLVTTKGGPSELRSSTPVFSIKDAGLTLELKGISVDSISSRSPLCYIHASERAGSPRDYHEWTLNTQLDDPWWQSLLEQNPQYHGAILRSWNIRYLQNVITTFKDKEHVPFLLCLEMQDPALKAAAPSWHSRLFERERGNEEDEDGPVDLQFTLGHLYKSIRNDPLVAQLEATPEYRALANISRSARCRDVHDRIGRLRYKTVFETAAHRRGLAPWPIEVGDEIVLFAGSRAPLVVRRFGQKNRLIGTATIPGLGAECGWPREVSELQSWSLV